MRRGTNESCVTRITLGTDERRGTNENRVDGVRLGDQ